LNAEEQLAFEEDVDDYLDKNESFAELLEDVLDCY